MTDLLAVDDLRVAYPGRRSWFGKPRTVEVVHGVSFTIAANETLGLVGESGCGKSTTGRAVLGLLRPVGGSIRFAGRDLTDFRHRLPRDLRRDLQVVFQDPFSSLDPTKVVADLVGEPLVTHLGLRGAERARRVRAALERVGLSANHLERYPHEFSGGQRQRIAIARALILDPKLVVLDEPISALDVSTQSQIVNLLAELQQEAGVSYLFIAHDLTLVRHASHRIAVMYLGTIVEDGPALRVSDQPAHPYTQALLASVPVADPVAQRSRRALRRRLAGESQEVPPSAAAIGCPFAPRCRHVMPQCWDTTPVATPVVGGGTVRCHLYAQTTVEAQPVAGPVLADARSATVGGAT